MFVQGWGGVAGTGLTDREKILGLACALERFQRTGLRRRPRVRVAGVPSGAAVVGGGLVKKPAVRAAYGRDNPFQRQGRGSIHRYRHGQNVVHGANAAGGRVIGAQAPLMTARRD